eukprot:6952990-Karenia_brevis.AAC.1
MCAPREDGSAATAMIFGHLAHAPPRLLETTVFPYQKLDWQEDFVGSCGQHKLAPLLDQHHASQALERCLMP